MPKFSVPRGTSDILPDAADLWEALESKARRMCQSYGYREIRTPIYEDINLFKRSLGTTSEVVNKQLLKLAAASEDEGYALRPESTAAVVRSYLENSFDSKESLSKFFYIGPMFRGERPQKGRLRQFHQIGVEAIGLHSSSPYLDAEIMSLAMHLLEELVVAGARLTINSLGSKEDKAHIVSWLRIELGKQQHLLCEDCQDRFERNIFRVLDCKKEVCRRIVNNFVRNLPLSAKSKAYFDQVQLCLKHAAIGFEVSPHLVRGLDYYTHTVFEVTSSGLGSQDAVLAGGRYGTLVHELGGPENIEGIGFALGMERVLLARGQRASAPFSVDVFVIAMQEICQQQAFLLLQQLRRAGIKADMCFSLGSMKSQMGKADKAHARLALILGEDELKSHTATLKDMRAGKQETVPQEKIVELIQNKLTQIL